MGRWSNTMQHKGAAICEYLMGGVGVVTKKQKQKKVATPPPLDDQKMLHYYSDGYGTYNLSLAMFFLF